MQTVKDFVTNPVSGYSMIDERACAVPDYMVSGVEAPVAQLSFSPTISEVTRVPMPWRYLWRRPATTQTR